MRDVIKYLQQPRKENFLHDNRSRVKLADKVVKRERERCGKSVADKSSDHTARLASKQLDGLERKSLP